MPIAGLILTLLIAVAASFARAADVPGDDWTVSAAKPELAREVGIAFHPDAAPVLRGVRAVLIAQGDRIIAERYREGFSADSRFLSWSMAKSITHALAGVMVREGRLALDAPLPVPEWQRDPQDPRRAITLDQALRMSTGLGFSEDYEDLLDSDVIRMLFGRGAADMGGYAAVQALQYAPGTHWAYSSGTTNIVSRVIRDGAGGTEDSYRAFIERELLSPIGIRDAVLEFDAAGTLIGSSLVFMRARDYARFGLLYLRDGVWGERRILPEGWVAHAQRPTPGSHGSYGAHWWLSFAEEDRVPSAIRRFPADAYMARGHQEQSIIVVPSKGLVLVCLSLIDETDVSVLQDYLAGLIEAAVPDPS